MIEHIMTGSVPEIKSYVKENKEVIFKDRENCMRILRMDKRKSVQALAEYLECEYLKREVEIARVKALYDHDLAYNKVVCGVDEVGRGPLAGPIVAAAVILKPDSALENMILGIDDSKKLSKKRREELDVLIREKAVAYGIYEMSNLDIDRLGISYCNHEVFRGSIRSLEIPPELVLSDGYKVKDYKGENISLVKGDTLSASIACASIIAKVHRDKLMERLSVYYPEYGFDHNAGYASPDHIAALKTIGATPVHRMSFIRNFVSEE
ncbi:ribonuclease HII [Proteiniclasticum sp. C24MP]|uniref:ribonuclease HII n=1 Tax=Proteiniclasticum sp. C24MP TaxID=3374101 RepID=UPI003754741F